MEHQTCTCLISAGNARTCGNEQISDVSRLLSIAELGHLGSENQRTRTQSSKIRQPHETRHWEQSRSTSHVAQSKRFSTGRIRIEIPSEARGARIRKDSIQGGRGCSPVGSRRRAPRRPAAKHRREPRPGTGVARSARPCAPARSPPTSPRCRTCSARPDADAASSRRTHAARSTA